MLLRAGARARTWDSLVSWPGSLRALVTHYRGLLPATSSWDTDQAVLSHALLAPPRPPCSLGPDNTLWPRLGLSPRPFNDSASCWHGGGQYENCNQVLCCTVLYCTILYCTVL